MTLRLFILFLFCAGCETKKYQIIDAVESTTNSIKASVIRNISLYRSAKERNDPDAMNLYLDSLKYYNAQNNAMLQIVNDYQAHNP